MERVVIRKFTSRGPLTWLTNHQFYMFLPIDSSPEAKLAVQGDPAQSREQEEGEGV